MGNKKSHSVIEAPLLFYFHESERVVGTGIISLNLTTDALYFSPGFALMMGLHDGIQNLNEIFPKIHCNDREELERNFKNCKRKGLPYYCEIRLNSGLTYISVSGKIDRNQSGIHMLNIFSDITKQKNLLEEKVSAESASNMKSIYVAKMCHDIRTPVNAIVGVTTLMLNSDEIYPSQTEYLDIIIQSSGMLLSIVNDVLDFSKIESGQLNINSEKVDINQLKDELNILFEGMNKNKNLTLKFVIDQQIKDIVVDNAKIKQILVNLITNSVKFTEVGGVILITIMKNGSFLKFEVKDTGIGIDEVNKAILFQPFVQADNSKKTTSGVGLGLSICKNLVQLMGGEIDIFSTKHVGTTVTFTIPIVTPEGKKRASSILSSRSSSRSSSRRSSISSEKDGVTLIIVEDNIPNQKVLSLMFEKLKFIDYIIYSNGQELVDKIEKYDANKIVILMDLYMPVMDGYTATKTLRDKGYKCPIIAYTANAMLNERQICLDVGMDDFLLKPVLLEDLDKIITKWVGKGKGKGKANNLSSLESIEDSANLQ